MLSKFLKCLNKNSIDFGTINPQEILYLTLELECLSTLFSSIQNDDGYSHDRDGLRFSIKNHY